MRNSFVTTLYLEPARFADALRQEDEYWSAMFKRPEFRGLVEK